MLKCRIGRIDLNLCQHRRNPKINTSVKHFLTHCILKIIADVPLTHRDTDGKRYRDIALRIRPDQRIHRILDHPDLRAVAVGNDDLTALLNQVADGFGCPVTCHHLFGKVLPESISAKSNDHSSLFLLCHTFSLLSGPGRHEIRASGSFECFVFCLLRSGLLKKDSPALSTGKRRENDALPRAVCFLISRRISAYFLLQVSPELPADSSPLQGRSSPR